MFSGLKHQYRESAASMLNSLSKEFTEVIPKHP